MMEKGLTVTSGQTHVQKYSRQLLHMIMEGEDTTFLVSHHASLEDAPDMYRHWHDDQNEFTKIVLKPGLEVGEVETLTEFAHEQW
jgi:threonine dehydrogenase-like Zn-dependent dehydrogenase